MRVEVAKKLLESISTLQNSYSTRNMTSDDKQSTIMLSCDIKLNLKPKDAIKLESEFKAMMAEFLAPYVDQSIKDLQSEVSK